MLFYLKGHQFIDKKQNCNILTLKKSKPHKCKLHNET